MIVWESDKNCFIRTEERQVKDKLTELKLDYQKSTLTKTNPSSLLSKTIQEND